MIELLVAVSITTIGLLGLFQAVYATINFNMGNQLRGEAVSYGDEVMGHQVIKPFALISTTGNDHFASAPRSINTGFWNFSSDWTSTSVSPNTRSVQVLVSWRYKGARFTHTLSSMVSQ